MKIVLLGAPGCGKGTQASLISEKLSIPHISTGDIFRENITKKTEIGLKIKSIIDAGDLCPNDLTIEIVRKRLLREDCKKGFLLDGFPRNIEQAEALSLFGEPDKVIDIVISFDKIEKRITGRRSCACCKNSYHIDYIGNVKKCPNCGGDLYVRADDNPDSVKERLRVYKSQTEPLIEYYRSRGKLYCVNGEAGVTEVFDLIMKVIK